MYIPWRRVAATPRVPRGSSQGAGRGDAAGATSIVRGLRRSVPREDDAEADLTERSAHRPDACELRIELKGASDGEDARPLLPGAHDLFAVGLDACVGSGAGAAPSGAVALAAARDVDVHVAAVALRLGSGDEAVAAAALDACPGLFCVPAPDDREVRLFRSAPLPDEVAVVELLRPPELPEGITEL